MESDGCAVYKHIIVALGEEVTVRPTDFTACIYCLDDPSADRGSSNFNEIALLIDHLTGSR
jgi:hypothetical protein